MIHRSAPLDTTYSRQAQPLKESEWASTMAPWGAKVCLHVLQDFHPLASKFATPAACSARKEDNGGMNAMKVSPQIHWLLLFHVG